MKNKFIVICLAIIILILAGLVVISSNKQASLELDIKDSQKEISQLELLNANLMDDISTLEEDYQKEFESQIALYEEKESQYLELQQELETYKMDYEQLEELVDKGLILFEGNYEFLLTDSGIEDFTIILEDLKSSPELISFEPVLGGSMFFTKAILINDRWVFAQFEDGHIFGYGIYEYEIEDKEIEWTVIVDYLF